MYNDEKNLYHYTYRKDGSEPWDARTAVDAPYRESRDEGPGKKAKKNRGGAKIVALALSCALLGGAAGAGVAVWGGFGGGNSTDVYMSNRTAATVSVKAVDGKNAMTDAEVYAANVNSVVSISTTGSSGTNYFGQSVETASAGSGFVLTADGYLVTNQHVVANANTVKVTLYNGDTYDAKIIGSDQQYDIAVLKIDASALQPVTMGDSDTLNVGDHVLAVGNPLGDLTFSMSGGMVSSVNRAINVDGTPFNMIQTDASINPGNSGGPLFNQYGEVVGIVSAKYSSYSSQSVEGLGFAIPMNDVLAMIQDIMTNGYVTNKPYLGINQGTMTAQMAAQYRYDVTEGVFVYSVEEGSAADKAGLKMGDVITKVDDTDIATSEDLVALKKSYSAGDTSTFTIYRAGGYQTVSVTWDSVPADSEETQVPQQEETQQPSQDGGNSYGGSMEDLFNYFFNGGYNR
ncbi:S1C family serine protease [Oscillibacter sp. GMB15532]|uniref:S1C family serine protease n=1 Tax=Oscillibacter sp. GMB15532 TaxID=3230022 RepID=UPI0034E05665